MCSQRDAGLKCVEQATIWQVENDSLVNAEDLRGFVFPESQPNFVSLGKVTSEVAVLRGDETELPTLSGKIALIPQADPGYDWLFGQGISGLVTTYGGANSHMAIRAAEFGLPAAIGVGEILFEQLDDLPDEYQPDVAVIIVGGNDITHRVPVATSVSHLTEAIARLRSRGTQVVVGTCPDLGALRPVPQPLRSLGSRMSRQLALAQADAAVAAGAYAVSLRHAVGPFFISQPDEMFSLDRFHPSALGYRRTAEALLPAVAGSLGFGRTSAATRHPRGDAS